MEPQDLTFALQSFTHLTRGEELQFDYKLDQADDTRDALAKAIYGRLFSWIVCKVNDLLGPKGQRYEDAKKVQGGITEVGILDIFGFENFEHNSFEQVSLLIVHQLSTNTTHSSASTLPMSSSSFTLTSIFLPGNSPSTRRKALMLASSATRTTARC